MKKSFASFAIAAAVLGAAASAAAQPAAAKGGSDHDAQVGHLAVGYMGFRTLTVGDGSRDVGAPVIGARYWIDDMLGIDAGLGLAIGAPLDRNGTQKFENGAETKNSATAILLHAGVPLALANTGHFSWQIVPELNLGFGSATTEDVAGGVSLKDEASGFYFDVGARAGAEIHFGFMGLPQLSLQGSVGLKLALANGSNDPRNDGNKVDYSSFRLRTDSYNNPWNIFTSNVAALYYF